MDLIIFDLDGTLIDSGATLLAAQAETFRRCGRTHPGREAGLQVIGLSLDVALARLAGLGQPDELLTRTYREVIGAMHQHAVADPAFRAPLFPGVPEVLALIRQQSGLKLGIATGKSRKGTELVLAQYGWEGLFDTVQSADDAPSKPHPGMALRAMAETGAAAERTAMIGDSSYDIEMAIAAGITPVAVSWGFQPAAALAALGARHILSDLRDLPAVLGLAGRQAPATSSPPSQL